MDEQRSVNATETQELTQEEISELLQIRRDKLKALQDAGYMGSLFGGSGLGKWLIVLWLGLVCFGGAVTATVIILKKNKEKAR